MRTHKSRTHHRRTAMRTAELKTWADPGSVQRAFSNTEGDRGDGYPRGSYYEAVSAPGGCQIYTCTRVFTRVERLPIIIGGEALEAAQTMVWLGTNQRP